MLAIIGVVVVFAMVFGGYILAGGKMAIIIKALPFEFMMIGGAAAGSFMIGNKGDVVKSALGGLKKVFGKPQWNDQDYQDLLCLLFGVLKLVRSKGMIALEQHVENPEQSNIFGQYPKIMKDQFAIDFICDTLRMMTMNFEDAGQVSAMMDKVLAKHLAEQHAPAGAMQVVADAIPALGIVAAVLGVIKTMASISEPVEVLGALIGGALVGTFLGVFLSYGFVGPFATKMKQVIDTDHKFYMVIRAVLVSHLQGNAPQISAEVGRTNVPSKMQPNFKDMEALLGNVNVG